MKSWCWRICKQEPFVSDDCSLSAGNTGLQERVVRDTYSYGAGAFLSAFGFLAGEQAKEAAYKDTFVR
jgi:hypothetical protein